MRKIHVFGKIATFVMFAATLLCFTAIICACTANNSYDGQLLRLHIKANSNSAADQNVKFAVREAVNAYICENVKKTSFDEAYRDIAARLDDITAIAIETLGVNGFDYGARATLGNEYFPARRYGELVVPDGNYDALVIELGSGAGDNWWCVVYPPLCYGETERFSYKSFFAELFG